MPRERAIDKASQFRSDDPIARLIVHYYYPCDLVRRDYDRVLRALIRQKKPTSWRASQAAIYLSLWLAMLFAVAEGFRDLGLRDQEIEYLFQDESFQRLKRLRNGTFHYQKHHEKLSQFFLGPGASLAWAQRLHAAFDRFFREYHIEVTVNNLVGDTRG